MEKRSSGKPNRLINESSPYLQQHAYNPVDWHAWNDEALEKARRLDRPILLSVGYSACHWCHVMERESFEDDEIAAVMNENFVNIKVDREERPDVDAIYMNYVQMTTGAGGWPLTAFLTPGQVPFYGGTYFPPRDQYGRPGFKRVLESVAEAYRTRRPELEKMGPEIVKRLQQMARFDVPEQEVDTASLDEAQRSLSTQFDRRWGGFGAAPKFPSTMALAFLLRHHRRTGSSSSLEMVERSLDEMARGGIYDQLGGGFHRYSVDERWLVPHFEKMLYDNALLAKLYVEAHQATGNEFHRRIAEETLTYVQREMTDPSGAFYSAQDADSEGEEGKYYVWSAEEIEEVLGADASEVFCDFYGVSPQGNFEGANILHRRFEFDAFARSADRSPQELRELLDSSRQLLLKRRRNRVKPGRDEKALAAWNGLMLTAFAGAAFALDRSDFLETAVRNAEFLRSKMIVGGRLRRSWKDGVAKLNAYAEDYAAVIDGWLTLYEAGGGTEWLREARRLMDRQCELFEDPRRGDFYFTSSDHETLLVRQKEHLDNATPSGNSISCLNLLRLAGLTGRRKYRERAERMLRQVAAALGRHPLAFGVWLQALDFYAGPLKEVAIVGSEGRHELLAPIRRAFLPNKVLVISDVPDSDEIRMAPLLEGKESQNGKAAAYVCENFVCSSPCTTPEELERQLGRRQADA